MFDFFYILIKCCVSKSALISFELLNNDFLKCNCVEQAIINIIKSNSTIKQEKIVNMINYVIKNS